MLNIEGVEDIEDSFLDDNEDDSSFSSPQNLYSYYSFPVEEQKPTNDRFEEKHTTFVKSVETLKDLLKRGEGSTVNNVNIKVMYVRTVPHGVEYDIESTKNKDKGISAINIYEPEQKIG